jgi:hypothetical protein
LGREFLKVDAENVNFAVMPGFLDYAQSRSYITILLDEWLELVNERLNPFSKEMTPTDVSILTRGEDRRLYVTDGNWQGDSSWGSSSRGPSSQGSNETNHPGFAVNTTPRIPTPTTDPPPTEPPTDEPDTTDPADSNPLDSNPTDADPTVTDPPPTEPPTEPADDDDD